MKLAAFLLMVIGMHSITYADENLIHLIRNDMANGKISKILLYSLPYDIRTFVAVTPEMLEEMAGPREIDQANEAWNDLIIALDKTSSAPIDDSLDLRTGIVFLDTDGVEEHSIYLNGRYFTGTGRKAIIDGVSMKVSKALQTWADRYLVDRQLIRGENNTKQRGTPID